MKRCFAILRGHESDVLSDGCQPFIWGSVPLVLRLSFCLSVAPSQEYRARTQGAVDVPGEKEETVFPRAGGHPDNVF